MRNVVYSCAMSLDGFIARANGEYDWIAMDPDIDFAEMQARYDTYLIGRKSYEVMRRMEGGVSTGAGVRNYVFSRTLAEGADATVTVSADAEGVVAGLRAQKGKDISLFGGGELFRSLLGAGLVDRVEVGVVAVLLGGGIPLLPVPAEQTGLKLIRHRVYEKTGTVLLEYEVGNARPRP
jgi:dihydrofolate reductase